MNQQFSRVATKRPNRNKFDMSHQRKTALKAGQLVPVLCVDVLPGDFWNMSNEFLMRLAPLVAPIMHQVDVYCHSWYVPNRILWDGWQDFYSPKTKGADAPVHPYVQFKEGLEYFELGSIADHLGYPANVDDSGNPVPYTGTPDKYNALPFAGFYKIFYEFYRDQNLQTEDEDWNELDLPDGNVTTYLDEELCGNSLFRTPFLRNWEQDYFTSALPWPQKGEPVELPLGTSADLRIVTPEEGAGFANAIVREGAPPFAPLDASQDGTLKTLDGDLIDNTPSGANIGAFIDQAKYYKVDLTDALAASIEDFRVAMQLQKVYELFARVGTRYNEIVKGEFDVTIPDYRLDRPEYLGGGLVPVTISEVLQTSATDPSSTPQANMAGHGIALGHSKAFKKAFVEHGWIISLVSIMPKPDYMQGIPKRLLKLDMFDYARPLFAHLGEQEVYNKELFYSGNPSYDNQIFGYQQRYIEYKQMQSTVHGQFKHSLDFWHWARKVDGPVLNEAFIQCNPDARIFSDLLGDQFYLHVSWSGYAQRALPLFAIPY